MSGPTGRILQLLSLLQTHRFWPGPELAGRLEVSERTLRRDIERLRDLGYPVDATPGVDGGYRLAAGSHLPPLLLDDDEAVAIAVGLRTAAGAAVEGIEETSLRALAKLQQLLPDRLRRRVDSIQDTVVVRYWQNADTEVSAGVLAVLAQGCRDHEEVRFDYRRRDGEESSRRVEPHQLVSLGRRWYLVAWDVRRSDWRTFRVDRLVGPRLAGGRFTPRAVPHGDAVRFVEEGLRRAPMPYAATVVVVGADDEIAEAARWLGADVSGGDGRAELALRTDSLDWLSSMIAILAVQFDVEVSAEPEVLDRLRVMSDRVEAILGSPR
ncbi:MAG: YafY family protein [Actinomycetota bacterium]